MQSRIYRWRDIGGILRSFILYSRTKEAGSCCRWQHLVKGRKGGREERRRFFGDFETKRESGTRRGEKVKGRKKYRGGSRRKSTKETRLQEVANAPRVTAVAQQYNPITLSCNPTSPPRRGSSCYPRLHHCSFPRSFPPTLPPPPSHHLFSGCAAYDSLREPYPR